MKINNIKHLEEDVVSKDSFGLITKSLSAMAGSQKLYVNIDVIPPKTFSTKYHSRSQQEEFFLILEGNGILRLNDKEYPITTGDFVAKPCAQNIAHSFYNSSNATLTILDVGTIEKEDTCYYPDEEMYLHKVNGLSQVYNKLSLINDWQSDPNDVV